MFGRRHIEDKNKNRQQDEQLRGLLKQWQGLEPGADFESGVWRRIAFQRSVPVRVSTVSVLREWLLPEPAWAMAVIAAVVVGIFAGMTPPRQSAAHISAVILASPATLAGSYLKMASGGVR